MTGTAWPPTVAVLVESVARLLDSNERDAVLGHLQLTRNDIADVLLVRLKPLDLWALCERCARWDAERPPGPDGREIAKVMIVLAALFAMIGLMPKFDGTKPGDWDRQESDDETRR